MTSKQVMLTAWMTCLLCGCQFLGPTGDEAWQDFVRGKGAQELRSPYDPPRVWIVAPFRNESGNARVDELRVTDQLIRQLENASGLDVLPLNRTLEAMESLEMDVVRTPAEARTILATVGGADAILVGSITAYDPYDPPKLGLKLELYDPVSRGGRSLSGMEVRELSRTATGDAAIGPMPGDRPMSLISHHFDAADPDMRSLMKRYANRRGVTGIDDDEWRLYRISMDLFTEFVSYVAGWRLLHAETVRLAGSRQEAYDQPAP